MERYDLPKKTAALWQMRLTVFCAVLLALVSVTLFLTKWMLILVGALFLIFTLFILIFIPLHIKSYKIEVSRETITINRGVIIRASHIMPFSRFIYAEEITTPVARLMGLSALSIKIARGFVIVPEMRSEDVKRLIKTISGENKDET